MMGIVKTKFLMLIRQPWSFIALPVLTIVFTLALGGGFAGSSKTDVLYAVDTSTPYTEQWEMYAKDDKTVNWIETDRAGLTQALQDREAQVGVVVGDGEYTVRSVAESADLMVAQSAIAVIHQTLVQEVALLEDGSDEALALVGKWQEEGSQPAFLVETVAFNESSDFVYDPSMQAMLGYSLFFVMYSVGYGVLPLLLDRQDGVWDRLVLSRVSKWQLYSGYLLYSFLIGYVQLVITFCILRYVFDFNFYGQFGWVLIAVIPYLFAIVALCLLLVSVVPTVGYFNALISLLSVSMAMLGGAYWPIEIVTSDVLLALSHAVPIAYGMEALKGVTMLQESLGEILQPLSVLLLMGVVMMGIGVQLMERRRV